MLRMNLTSQWLSTPEASVQFRSEVQEIVPVAPGAMTREPVHCDLNTGGLEDDFNSENRSVMFESFLMFVTWEQAAEAGFWAANATSSAAAETNDLAGVIMSSSLRFIAPRAQEAPAGPVSQSLGSGRNRVHRYRPEHRLVRRADPTEDEATRTTLRPSRPGVVIARPACRGSSRSHPP